MKWDNETAKAAQRCKYALLEDGKIVGIHQYDPKSHIDLGIKGLSRNENNEVVFVSSYSDNGNLSIKSRKVICFGNLEFSLKRIYKNMQFKVK